MTGEKKPGKPKEKRGFRPLNPPKTKEAEENFNKFCVKKK